MVIRPKPASPSPPHSAFRQQIGERLEGGRLREWTFNPNGESGRHRRASRIRVLGKNRDNHRMIWHFKGVGHTRAQTIGQIKTLDHFCSFEFGGDHEIHQQQKHDIDHRSQIECGPPVRASVKLSIPSTLGPSRFGTRVFRNVLFCFRSRHQEAGSSRTKCTLASAPSTRALAARNASRTG